MSRMRRKSKQLLCQLDGHGYSQRPGKTAQADRMAKVQASWNAMKKAMMTADSTTAVWSRPH